MMILVGVGSRCSLPANTVRSAQHKSQQKCNAGDGHNGDDDRIDHGADHLASGIGLLIQVFGQLLEHRAHRAGDFSRSDHVDIQVIKDLRVLAEGLGKTLAGLDLELEIHDNDAEFMLLDLGTDGFEGILQADARTKHYGQLVGEVENIFSAGAEFYPEPFLTFWRSGYGVLLRSLRAGFLGSDFFKDTHKISLGNYFGLLFGAGGPGQILVRQQFIHLPGVAGTCDGLFSVNIVRFVLLLDAEVHALHTKPTG